MHPRTQKTLDRLGKVKWFANVGVYDSQDVIALSSWESAVAKCGTVEWEDTQMEAANAYRSKLLAASPERFMKWNDVVDDVKPAVVSLVTSKCMDVELPEDIIKVVLINARWDILHVCMEAEFADVEPPGFYAGLLHWYMKGHFPCGLEANPPPGKLIVY